MSEPSDWELSRPLDLPNALVAVALLPVVHSRPGGIKQCCGKVLLIPMNGSLKELFFVRLNAMDSSFNVEVPKQYFIVHTTGNEVHF